MKTRLKPMGVGAILDNAFSILRERFWTFQAVNFFSFLPALIILLIGAFVTVFSALQFFKPGMTMDQVFWSTVIEKFGMNIAILAILFIFFFVAVIIGSIYMVYGNINLYKCGLHQEKCSYKIAFEGIRGKRWRYIGTQLLILLATLPLTIYYYIIVLNNPLSAWRYIMYLNYIIYFLFCLSPVIVFLEDKGIMHSLARSFSIMAKHRLRVLGTMLAVYLLGYALLLILIVLLVIPISICANFFNVVTLILTCVFCLASILVFSIIISYSFGPIVAIYYDLLIRKEGYDIKQQLGEETADTYISQPERGLDT